MDSLDPVRSYSMHDVLLSLAVSLALGAVPQVGPDPETEAARLEPLPRGVFLGPEDPRDLGPIAVLNQQASDAAIAAHPGFRTSRSGRDFTYRLPIAPGSYDLRVGYFEAEYFAPRCRVFSILANGAPLQREIDLCVEAELLLEHGDTDGNGRMSRSEREAMKDYWIQEVRKPAVVEPSATGLDLRFVGSRDIREGVAVSWFELTNRKDGTRYLVDCGSEDDLPGWFEAEPIGQALVARYGSRTFLDLRPQFNEFQESPLGIFSEAAKKKTPPVIGPVSAIIGFQLANKVRYALPLFRDLGPDVRPFDRITERRTLTRVEYDVAMDGYEGTITFTAPFHPTDAKIATAPYFDVQFTARRVKPDAPDYVKAILFLPVVESEHRRLREGTKVHGGVIRSTVDGREVERGLFLDAYTQERQFGRVVPKRNGLMVSADLQVPNLNEPATAYMVYAAYVADPVLTVGGDEQRFYYTRHFPTVEAVAEYALSHRDEGLAAADAVDSLVEDAILPDDLKDVVRYAFSSFLANTNMTVGNDGSWWYSCQEGFCRYHATVDVEYNAAPFYLWFAPDLLRHLLDAWPRYLKEAPESLEGHKFLSHDIGLDTVIDGQQYEHDMPVEENSSYLLMLHAFWSTTGDDAFAVGKADVVTVMMDYLLAADPDGDGFPEIGTANTIDDASAAIQFSREQIYLGVKSASALIAGAEVLEAAGRDAAEYRERAARARETLDSEAWLGDHYAVCLDRNTEGLTNPWDNLPEHTNVPRESVRTLPPGPLPGWDDSHPYTTLGLLYLYRAGVELPFDADRLLQDARTAAVECERTYADAHSSSGPTGWVSLNLFRDAMQCYLGDDVLDRSARYAALQRFRARAPDQRDRAGFCDAKFNRYLSYYPRGTAAFALVDAAAGIRLDRRARTLSFKPVRAPVKVPLPMFARWDPADYRIPWFEATVDAAGAVAYSLSHADLIDGMEITVDLTLVGGEVVRHGE